MQEARIILPVSDNDGESLAQLHEKFKSDVIARLGGFTTYYGQGGWSGPNGQVYREPVVLYDIACQDDDADTLRNLAKRAGQAANQQAVYLRLPNGNVEFVTR